jgi:hypothetical protein
LNQSKQILPLKEGLIKSSLLVTPLVSNLFLVPRKKKDKEHALLIGPKPLQIGENVHVSCQLDQHYL